MDERTDQRPTLRDLDDEQRAPVAQAQERVSLRETARSELLDPTVGSRVAPEPASFQRTAREQAPLLRSDLTSEERRQGQLETGGVTRNVVARGVRQGLATIPAQARALESIGRGLVGDEEGSRRAAERAADIQQSAVERAQLPGLSDVRSGRADVLEYAGGLLGSQLPVMAQLVASGGVGAAAGRVVASRVTRRAVERQALRRARDRLATRVNLVDDTRAAQRAAERARGAILNRGVRRGGMAGTFAAGFGLQAGEAVDILNDPDATARERALAALGGAALTAGFETLPIVNLFDKVGLGRTLRSRVTRDVKDLSDAAAEVGRGAATQALIEGGTEVGQGLLMDVAHRTINENIEFFSDEQLSQMLEEGIAGALIGGLLGGLTSVTLPSRGPTEAEMEERIAEAQRKRAQPSPDADGRTTEQRWDAAQSATLGRLGLASLDGAGSQELAGALEEDVDFQTALEVGNALRILLDPDVDSNQEIAFEIDGEQQTMPAAEYAAELLYQRYGINIADDETLNAMRRLFLETEGATVNALHGALENRLAIEREQQEIEAIEDTVPANREERTRLERELARRQARLRELRRETIDEDDQDPRGQQEIEDELLGRNEETAPEEEALVSPTGDALEETAPRIRPVLAPTEEGPAIADSGSTGDFGGSTVLGPLLPSNRLDKADENAVQRSQQLADRLNQETGGSGQYAAQPAGDALVRVLRARAGLEDSKTAVNNEDVRRQVIEEARKVRLTGSSRRYQGKREFGVQGLGLARIAVAEQQLSNAKKSKNKQQIAAAETALEQVKGEVAQAAIEPTVENYREAQRFLNQFDTIVEEQVPGSVLGTDPLRLTIGELRSRRIIEPVKDDSVRTEEKIEVVDANGSRHLVDLVSLTSAMIGRGSDFFAGRGGSREEQQLRGQQFEQQGGSGISDENLSRALVAGLSELFTTNGMVPAALDNTQAEALFEQRAELEDQLQATTDNEQRQQLEQQILEVDRQLLNDETLQRAINPVAVAWRQAGGMTKSFGALTTPSQVRAAQAEIAAMTDLTALRAREQSLIDDINATGTSTKRAAERQAKQQLLAELRARQRTVELLRQRLADVAEGANPKSVQRAAERAINRIRGKQDEVAGKPLKEQVDELAQAALNWPDSKLRALMYERLSITEPAAVGKPKLPDEIAAFDQTGQSTAERAQAVIDRAFNLTGKDGTVKYIGFGSRRSMAGLLRSLYGGRANTSSYGPEDVVHVAVPSSQRERDNLSNQQALREELERAVAGGATVVFETYNGEAVQQQLEAAGYTTVKSGKTVTARRPAGTKTPRVSNSEVAPQPAQDSEAELDRFFTGLLFRDRSYIEKLRNFRKENPPQPQSKDEQLARMAAQLAHKRGFSAEAAQRAAETAYNIVESMATAFNIAVPEVSITDVFRVNDGGTSDRPNGMYAAGTHTIRLHPRVFNEEGRLSAYGTTVIVHEMSHALEVEATLQAGPEAAAAVAREYNAWRREQEKRLDAATSPEEERQILAQIMADKRGPLGVRPSQPVADQEFLSREYVLDPREWFADSAARMLLEDSFRPTDNPVTLELFRKVAEALKRAYQAVIQKRLFPPQELPALRDFLVRMQQQRMPAVRPRTQAEQEVRGFTEEQKARLADIAAEEERWLQTRSQLEAYREDFEAAGVNQVVRRYSALARLMGLYTGLRSSQRAADRGLDRAPEDQVARLLEESNKELQREQGGNATVEDKMIDVFNEIGQDTPTPPTGQAPPWAGQGGGSVRDLEPAMTGNTAARRRNETARLNQSLQDAGADLQVRVVNWAEFVAATGADTKDMAEVSAMRHRAVDGRVLVWVNEDVTIESERRTLLTREVLRELNTTMPDNDGVLAGFADAEDVIYDTVADLRDILNKLAPPRNELVRFRENWTKTKYEEDSASYKAREFIQQLLERYAAEGEAVGQANSETEERPNAAALPEAGSGMGDGGKEPPKPPGPPPGATPDDGYNAYHLIKAPFSAEGFLAMRDLIQSKLTGQELAALGSALMTPRVRQQIITFLRVNKTRPDEFLTDEFDMITLGVVLARAEVITLEPNASSIVAKLVEFAYRMLGFIRKSDQAKQIMDALHDSSLEQRRSRLFEKAKAGSHLAQKVYTLTLDQLFEIQGLLRKAKKPEEVTVEQIRNNPFLARRLTAKQRELLLEDIVNGVYSKAFLKEMTETRSDFIIDPDKQFVLQTVTSNPNYLQQGAQHVAAAIRTFSPMFEIWIGEAMRARFTGNPAILNLINRVNTDVTARGYGEAMFARRMRRAAAFHSEFNAAIENLTPEQEQELRDDMLGRKAATSSEAKAARQKVRVLMRRLRAYGVEAKLPLGDRGPDYVPWVFDPMTLNERADEVLEDWMRPEYAKDWDKLARERGRLTGKTMTEIQRREFILGVINGIITENNGLADNTDASMAQPRVSAMFKRDLAFLDTKGDAKSKALLSELFSDDIGRTIFTYIDQMVKRVEYVRTFGANGERFTNAKRRAKALGATPRDLKLMDKIADSALGRVGLEVHPFWRNTAGWLLRNTIQRPVYADDNQKPFATSREAFDRMQEDGVKGRVRELDSGGYFIERDITADPARFRQAQSALVIYQNLVLLPLAALTNMADAAGIAFRTGQFNLALRSYMDGVRETVTSVKTARDDPRTRRQRMTDLRKLAEELGIVEFTVTSDIIGQLYGGNFMSGRMRKVNDAFFRLNGMEHLTRTLRLSAFAAGRRFLVERAAAALAGNEAALDELRQLDLELEDIVLDADGNLELLSASQIEDLLPANMTAAGARDSELSQRDFEQLTRERDIEEQRNIRRVARDDRVKQALNRMVDESILRPSPNQRPTWMNNPNWQIFAHLKGFFFTYHERVLRRAYTQAAQGNFSAIMYMGLYPAMMLFMDLFRDAITDGAGGDEQKKDWAATDYLSDALRRSGVYGTFGFFPDMWESRKYGGSLLAEMLGPTTDHIERLGTTMLGRGSLNSALERTIPGASVIPEVPLAILSWPDYFMSELGGPSVHQLIQDTPIFNPEEQQTAREQAMSRLIGR